MEFLSLKAFIAISREGSFSRAAEQLFVTQPAVSKRIAALEQRLNVKLFDRIGKQVSLTEAGAMLLPHARSIIDAVDATEGLLQSLSGKVSGTLSIASSHHIGLHRLPPLLKCYSRQYPEVELDLKFLDSESACDQVRQGELELALITLPATLSQSLQTQIVWHDPLVATVSADDVMAHQPISLTQLVTRKAILPQSNTFTRSIINRWFNMRGLQIETIMETNNLETIRKMVEIGLGWSILPATMLNPGLAPLQLPELKLARNLGIIHHRNRTLSNAASAMIEMLQQKRAV